MLAWLRNRRHAARARAALVEADARDLISRFGDGAYIVARDRHRAERQGITWDAARPPGHWSVVKVRVAAMSGAVIGLDTSTRFIRDR